MNYLQISRKIALSVLAILLGIMLYLPLMNITMEEHHHSDTMESCLMGAMPAVCPMIELGDYFWSFGSSTIHIFQILSIQISVLVPLLAMMLLFVSPKLETAFSSLPPPRWRLALARGLIHPKSY